MIFAWKMPEFDMIIARKIFFPNLGRGARAPCPVSNAYAGQQLAEAWRSNVVLDQRLAILGTNDSQMSDILTTDHQLMHSVSRHAQVNWHCRSHMLTAMTWYRDMHDADKQGMLMDSACGECDVRSMRPVDCWASLILLSFIGLSTNSSRQWSQGCIIPCLILHWVWGSPLSSQLGSVATSVLVHFECFRWALP